MGNHTTELVAEMSVGVVGYNFVLAVLACLVYPPLGYQVFPIISGLCIGMAASILMLLHIAVITEKVLDYANEQYANHITIIHSIIRKALFLAGMAVFWNIPQVNVLAIIFGAMGMKAGAYLQPVVHKLFIGRRGK